MQKSLGCDVSKQLDFVQKTDLWNKHKEDILLDLSSKRWTVMDDFLPLDIFKKLTRSVSRDHQEGLLRPATVGRAKKRRTNVRGDEIRWIRRAECRPAVHAVLDVIDELQLHLRQQLFLPLQESECHFAVYPPGARYVKHLDCHHNQNNRILSFILYLNRRNWSKSNGGQLRMWLDSEEFMDVTPIGNRLVIFDSSEFYHEVLPANRPRMSLTGWMRRSNGF